VVSWVIKMEETGKLKALFNKGLETESVNTLRSNSRVVPIPGDLEPQHRPREKQRRQ
jgi:hypothetical protein